MTDTTESDPPEAIKGIGPAQAAQMRAAGITTAQALRAMGADAAYRAMLDFGAQPHFIAFYALHMALQGRPWNDCKGAEKVALRSRFDALKAETASDAAPAGIERKLNELGVGTRR